ncbi:MAG: glycosyltransferase family 4 protein [Verrucomicrobiota bacterium]
MILLSHPTGNNFSRALLAGLLKAGLLGRFVTSVAVKESAGWLNGLPSKLRGELLRRKFDLPDSFIETHPLRELCRLAASKSGARFLTRHDTGLLSWNSVYRGVDRAVARGLPRAIEEHQITAVYAYEDGALETFRAARRLGLERIYDLPIAYWETGRRLMAEEQERVPAWRITLEGMQDSETKLRAKTEELDLANTVVCPSQFVYDSLPESARENKRCIVAPFGSPPPRQRGPNAPSPGGDRAPQLQASAPLRILFAGSMTQRKGLADLFAAMQLVRRRDVQLVVFGSPVAPMAFYRREFSDFVYEAPRPHKEVLRLMETCDVLVLPSIVEGRALVQQEAMSCGLPLIITPNTGGEDLIEEGRTGFLVPIRSPEAIAEKVHWFADHRGELEAMREHARRKAAELTWSAYANAILAGMAEGQLRS